MVPPLSFYPPRIASHYCNTTHTYAFELTLGGSSSRGRSLFMLSLPSCFSSVSSGPGLVGHFLRFSLTQLVE